MPPTPESEVEEQVIEMVEAQLPTVAARLAAEVDRRALLANASDERFLMALRSAGVAELHAGMMGYKLDRRLPAAPPAETAELARRAAKAQIPLAALLDVYMVALGVYWDAIYDAILASEGTADARTRVIRSGTRYLHEYVAKISGLAAAEYGDERERVLHRRSLDRLAIVREFLSANDTLDVLLGHDLRAAHLAMVATGTSVAEILAPLGESPNIRSLSVSDDGAVWAWISGEAESVHKTAAAISPGPAERVRIGIGRLQEGPDGFRTTHRQAMSAHEWTVRLKRPCARYDELALPALVSESDATRTFVTDELGPVLSDPHRAERLLETLLAYLESGQNGTSTAAVLGVSARTVSHRLRLIEEMLGRPIASRAAELHVALRLRLLKFEAGSAPLGPRRLLARTQADR